MDKESELFYKGIMVGSTTQAITKILKRNIKERESYIARYKRADDQGAKRAADEIDSVIGLYEAEIARRNQL